MCLHSGEGHLTFTGPVHGKPSLAGVFSAALCQSGPGGAGAGLQADCRLDKHRSIPDPPFYRGRRRNPCQGASFCVLTSSSVKLPLTLAVFFFCSSSLSPHAHVVFQKTRSELDDVFATIADFMAQTTYQCKVSDYLPAAVCLQQQIFWTKM